LDERAKNIQEFINKQLRLKKKKDYVSTRRYPRTRRRSWTSS
jgi:hypothetical protein